jgi:hypothetical protein
VCTHSVSAGVRRAAGRGETHSRSTAYCMWIFRGVLTSADLARTTKMVVVSGEGRLVRRFRSGDLTGAGTGREEQAKSPGAWAVGAKARCTCN